ncbi:hypothetical protein KI387_021253, partial [Taxus chinensis]
YENTITFEVEGTRMHYKIRMKMVVFFLLLFLSALPACSSHSSPSYYSDLHALLTFKNSLSLDPLNSLRNWSPNHNTCNWTALLPGR